MSVKVSAPGSLMLFGEHAVLHNKHAISAAINKRLQVTLTPRNDNQIHIHSPLGTYSTTLSDLTITEPFTFVLAAIESQKDTLFSGFELVIESEMSPHFGLGTSAAVTVATIAALHTTADRRTLFHDAVAVVRKVQGRGSGADVAASVFGGTVFFRMEPLLIEPLYTLFDLTVVYSGSKMKTADVIALVAESQKKHPKLFDHLFSLMDSITLNAKEAILQNDRELLGELCNQYQGTMDTIGVNNRALSEIIYTLRASPHITGAKISGSGLGDCAIGLGTTSTIGDYPVLPISMSPKGVTIE